MKKYFEHLRPMERRLVIGVLVVLFIVLNWVFVKPHFSDWSKLSQRRATAERDLKTRQTAVTEAPEMEKQLKAYESEGEFVAQEDQTINFTRNIQAQSSQSGVQLQSTSRQITRTNDVFFIEQIQNINVLATDEQLVEFLYQLGSGASMIRVRDLELQPDQPRQRLNANIKLVASYQKNPKPATAAKPSPAKAK